MKLNLKQKHSQEQLQVEGQEQAVRGNSRQEFQSVEEMLRADARQVIPPDGIARRLKQTLAKEPRPAQGWWQRLRKKS